jgi:hypothetical protein
MDNYFLKNRLYLYTIFYPPKTDRYVSWPFFVKCYRFYICQAGNTFPQTFEMKIATFLLS